MLTISGRDGDENMIYFMTLRSNSTGARVADRAGTLLWRILMKRFVYAVAALSLTGCDPSTRAQTSDTAGHQRTSPMLMSFESCNDLLAELRQNIGQEMRT